jgi:hypothetical protein
MTTQPRVEYVAKIPSGFHPKPSSLHAPRRVLSSVLENDTIPICITPDTPEYEKEFNSLSNWMPEFQEAHEIYGSVPNACPVQLDAVREFDSLTWLGNNFLAFLQIQAATSYIKSAHIDASSDVLSFQQKIGVLSEDKTLWAPFADVIEYEEFQISLKQWIFVPPAVTFALLVVVLFSLAHTRWHNNHRRLPSLTRWYRKYRGNDTMVGEDSTDFHSANVERETAHLRKIQQFSLQQTRQVMFNNVGNAPTRSHPTPSSHHAMQTDRMNKKRHSNRDSSRNKLGTTHSPPRRLYDEPSQIAPMFDDERDVHEFINKEQVMLLDISKRQRVECLVYAVCGFTLLTSQLIAFYQFFAAATHMLALVEDMNLMAVLYLLTILSQLVIGGCFMVIGLLPRPATSLHGVVKNDDNRWIRIPSPDVFHTVSIWLLYIIFFTVAYEATQLSTESTRTRYMTAALLLFLAGGAKQFFWSVLFQCMHGDLGTNGFRDWEQTNAEDRHLRMYIAIIPWLLAAIACGLLCTPHDDIVLAFFHRTDSSCWYFWPVYPMLYILSFTMLIIGIIFLKRAGNVISQTCGRQGLYEDYHDGTVKEFTPTQRKIDSYAMESTPYNNQINNNERYDRSHQHRGHFDQRN